MRQISSKGIERIECPKCGRRGRFEVNWVQDEETGLIVSVFKTIQHWVKPFGKHDYNCLTTYISLDEALELYPGISKKIHINGENIVGKIRQIISNGGNRKTLEILMGISHRLNQGDDVFNIQRDVLERTNGKNKRLVWR